MNITFELITHTQWTESLSDRSLKFKAPHHLPLFIFKIVLENKDDFYIYWYSKKKSPVFQLQNSLIQSQTISISDATLILNKIKNMHEPFNFRWSIYKKQDENLILLKTSYMTMNVEVIKQFNQIKNLLEFPEKIITIDNDYELLQQKKELYRLIKNLPIEGN